MGSDNVNSLEKIVNVLILQKTKPPRWRWRLIFFKVSPNINFIKKFIKIKNFSKKYFIEKSQKNSFLKHSRDMKFIL